MMKEKEKLKKTAQAKKLAHEKMNEEEEESLHGGEHLSPCKYCMPAYPFNNTFVIAMRWGILQYVPIKVLTALATFLLCHFELYETGHFSLRVGYPYISMITNVSQTWAMYCLVLFYHAMYENIKKMNPLAKFLSVKLVIFFTFWQSMIIAFFIDFNYLHATHDYTGEQVASGIQDFLICIEMFVASLAHIWVFPTDEFRDPTKGELPSVSRLSSVLNPIDLVSDMRDHLVTSPKNKKKKKK